MKTTALGTWRKPPLAYVVAELVISPYYNIAEKVPTLQDLLRTDFPRTIEGKEVAFMDANKPPAVQPVWQLVSADQQYGVLLGARVISLHATAYIDSDDFIRRWAQLLNAVHAAALEPFVERAGLRYIDLIVPTAGHVPAEYLVPQLQGIAPDGAQITGSMWAAAFQYDGCLVNMRAGAPAPQGVLLPPDFNALPLQKPNVMVEAEKRLKAEQPIGFIDTDCLREINQVFEADALAGIYTEMQQVASKTFNAALSELAKKEWT